MSTDLYVLNDNGYIYERNLMQQWKQVPCGPAINISNSKGKVWILTKEEHPNFPGNGLVYELVKEPGVWKQEGNMGFAGIKISA